MLNRSQIGKLASDFLVSPGVLTFNDGAVQRDEWLLASPLEPSIIPSVIPAPSLTENAVA